MSNNIRPRAVLVGIQLPSVSDIEQQANLAELSRLVHTLGYEVVATIRQKRDALAAAAVLGEGKLKELARLTGGPGFVPTAAKERKSKARERFQDQGVDRDVRPHNGDEVDGDDDAWKDDEGDESDRHDVHRDESDGASATRGGSQNAGEDGSAKEAMLVVVDHEISPSQARNLERATSATVLDRTGVIVDIFHRHARSREARLQVEIARLNYVAPRLRESGGSSERQHGKGSGESAIELDRRKIRDRIAELRQELAAIEKQDRNRRYARKDQLRVALVGYTNAGKSSLMRALTGSDVLIADKLFATLDTTVRALHPETKPRILVSDTVGFIQKLPHDLVASFRSTLDEALEASLLLYVVDASDPTFSSQLEVTRTVLHDIGAGSLPSKLLLNKADRLSAEQREELARSFPDALLLSAHEASDVAELHRHIVEFFEGAMHEEDLLVPYAKQALLGEVYENARVLSEAYDEAGTHLRVRALPVTLDRLRHAFGKSE